jgi:hypothetical protein
MPFRKGIAVKGDQMSCELAYIMRSECESPVDTAYDLDCFDVEARRVTPIADGSFERAQVGQRCIAEVLVVEISQEGLKMKPQVRSVQAHQIPAGKKENWQLTSDA